MKKRFYTMLCISMVGFIGSEVGALLHKTRWGTRKQEPYTLPKLGYAYTALEPYLDALTLKIHYTKHHQK